MDQSAGSHPSTGLAMATRESYSAPPPVQVTTPTLLPNHDDAAAAATATTVIDELVGLIAEGSPRHGSQPVAQEQRLDASLLLDHDTVVSSAAELVSHARVRFMCTPAIFSVRVRHVSTNVNITCADHSHRSSC